MAHLYEIDYAIVDALERAFNEDGELVDEEALAEAERLAVEKNTKIENIALWIKNLRSDAVAFKAEKDSFAKKQKAAENKAQNLSDFLQKILNGEKFKTTRVDITYRRSTTVEIEEGIDITEIPEEYIRTKVSKELDKTAALKDLKTGKEIPGLFLAEHKNMQIK